MANGIVETVVREEAEKIAAECLGVVTSAQAITEEVWALGTRVHTVLDRNSHRALLFPLRSYMLRTVTSRTARVCATGGTGGGEGDCWSGPLARCDCE